MLKDWHECFVYFFASFEICPMCMYFLFIFKNYLFIYFCLRWVFVAAQGLSLVVASRGYSSLWCTGFSCGGFSCCGARALGGRASVIAARGL